MSGQGWHLNSETNILHATLLDLPIPLLGDPALQVRS